jgi:putative ABC transport system permease protein
LGTAYTRALLYGLGRYWQGAVAGAAIQYHAEPSTLVMGAAISLIAALGAMTIALWRQSRQSARALLAMDFTQERPQRGAGRRRIGPVLAGLGIVSALAIIAYAQFGDVAEPSMAFFGAGSLLLASGIGILRHLLIRAGTGDSSTELTLPKLARRNIARRLGRSLTVAGLLAGGCFLVFAVSSMQEDLSAHAHDRASGTGGFALVADGTFPILDSPFEELDNPEVTGVALKVRDGDDASCLNLSQAQTPRLLGVNVEAMASLGAFAKRGEAESLWRLLDQPLEDGAIPALVGDANTAMWTLKKKTGVEKGDVLTYRDESGGEVPIKLVGALPMRLSVFQGTVLISESAFSRLFPSESGHRMFLIDAPEEKAEQVASAWRSEYDRSGLDVVPTVDRLLEFYSVETTYLAMFLVLGGLGLAIGSIGMGIVVLRNLLERRNELAMLGALGFERTPVYRLLFTEYGLLLVAGLGLGAVAAAVAMTPAVLAADSSLPLATQAKVAALVLTACATCLVLAILGGFRGPDPSALRQE